MIKDSEFRQNEVQRMLKEMIAAGVNQTEIAHEADCSRWILHLWLRKQHEPSVESYRAVKKAYAKFGVRSLPSTSTIIAKLQRSGIDLPSALGCTTSSIENWLAGKNSPQSRFRKKLVELYRGKKAA